MTLFLVILAIVAIGAGGYFLYQAYQPDALPEGATPEPLPAPEPEPEPAELPPLEILDPLTGEPLDPRDSDTIVVPLRATNEVGTRQFKKLRVNRTTAQDYRKFGIKFFRGSASDLRGRGYHCYYEEDDIISALELYLLYELMFGEDYEEYYDERYDELEEYYEEDAIVYENEAAIRAFENEMNEYEEVADEDVISESEIDAGDVAVAAVGAAVIADAVADELAAEEQIVSDEAMIEGAPPVENEMVDAEAAAAVAIAEAASPADEVTEDAADDPVEDES